MTIVSFNHFQNKNVLKNMFLKNIYHYCYIFFKNQNLYMCPHFDCKPAFVMRFFNKKNYYYHYMYNYFQECSGSLCKRVGQRRGEWEECFMTVSGHLTIQKREQLCYLACSKYCPHHVLIGKYRTVKNTVN